MSHLRLKLRDKIVDVTSVSDITMASSAVRHWGTCLFDALQDCGST